MEEKWGKKYLNNEEFDLDNCNLDKLEELKEKLINRKKEIIELINK